MAEKLCGLRKKGGVGGGDIKQIRTVRKSVTIPSGQRYGGYADFSSDLSDGDVIIGFFGYASGTSMHTGSVLLKTYPEDITDTNWGLYTLFGTSQYGTIALAKEPAQNNVGKARPVASSSVGGNYGYYVYCIIASFK